MQQYKGNVHTAPAKSTNDLEEKEKYLFSAKFSAQPHTSLCMQVIGNRNNGKNNAIAMRVYAVFVVSWLQNKRLHTLNRMHNEVWGSAEI